MSDLSVPKVQLTSEPNPELTPASADSNSEQFLRLHLVPDTTVLLPVQQLTEVLTIPIGQVVPIPHMPAWVMGIYNWRGDILWMVDLGHLCGLTPWYQQMTSVSLHPTVVLRVSDAQTRSSSAPGLTLGLVVNRVEDIEWCDPNQIQPLAVASVMSGLASFLHGYWWKPNDGTLAVLDGRAILAAMPH